MNKFRCNNVVKACRLSIENCNTPDDGGLTNPSRGTQIELIMNTALVIEAEGSAYNFIELDFHQFSLISAAYAELVARA